VVHSVII